MKPFQWTCPFCNRATTINEGDFTSGDVVLSIENKHGDRKGIFTLYGKNDKLKLFIQRMKRNKGKK